VVVAGVGVVVSERGIISRRRVSQSRLRGSRLRGCLVEGGGDAMAGSRCSDSSLLSPAAGRVIRQEDD
jgi:hypothetical protein